MRPLPVRPASPTSLKKCNLRLQENPVEKDAEGLKSELKEDFSITEKESLAMIIWSGSHSILLYGVVCSEGRLTLSSCTR